MILLVYNSTTNLFTYTPDPDYSGEKDVFKVKGTDVDGDDFETIVTAKVNPISDAPTVTVDSSAIHTDEDTAIALGFNAPVVKDDTDANNANGASDGSGVDGDNPERLSAITIDGIPDGAKLLYGGNSYTSNGSAITIVLNSGFDENGDNTNDHINGVSGNITMSKADFETMRVDPVPQSGMDIGTVTMSVTSYEVDDNGDPLTGVSGAPSTANVNVDVYAVTDTVSIAPSGNASGDEDSWIRIDNHYTVTKTADQDGSETYKLTFTGNFQNGSRYYMGSNPPVDMHDQTLGDPIAGNAFTISVSNSTGGVPQFPHIYIMTPDNDSTDVTSIEVKVEVTDSDGDTGSGAISIEEATTHFDMKVTPIANDIKVTTDLSSGNEDTKIDLELHLVNNDTPSEIIHEIIIDKIPNGARLFDKNGTEIYHNTSGGLGSKTITIDSGATDALDGIKIQPPGHSSKDFTLEVTGTTIDKDDNDANVTVTGSIAKVDVLVEVAPVAEIDGIDSNNDGIIDNSEKSDTDGDGTQDVTQNPDHPYTAHGLEDVGFDININDNLQDKVLKVTNQDDKSHAGHGSEDTFIVFLTSYTER